MLRGAARSLLWIGKEKRRVKTTYRGRVSGVSGMGELRKVFSPLGAVVVGNRGGI